MDAARRERMPFVISVKPKEGRTYIFQTALCGSRIAEVVPRKIVQCPWGSSKGIL